MLNKPAGCDGCSLWGDGRGFSRPEGTGSIGVLVVGEALGRNEEVDSLPFRPYAEAGAVLERAFTRSGYSREQFRLWNIVACRPPRDHLEGASYEVGAIEHCRVHFDRVVEETKPKVILALGNIPLRTLTGMAGRYQTITHVRGYILDCARYEIPVLPTMHPSYIRRGGMSQFGVLAHDLAKAVDVAVNGIPKRRPIHYVEHPSPDDARKFLELVRRYGPEGSRILTYDIETETSKDLAEDERGDDPSQKITQIQFSLKAGTGIAFPWEEPYTTISKAILETPGITIAGFNSWDYDDSRLRRYGIAVPLDRSHDLMWAWHHLQPDLPANLQFVASFYGMDFPWKHLGDSRPRYYGCADVDAPQRIIEKVFDDLRKRKVDRGYNRHVLQLWPVLARAADRGVPINDDARQQFGVELSAQKSETLKEMQSMVPDEILNVQPKLGYKRTPKDTTGMVERTFIDMVPAPCECVSAKRAKLPPSADLLSPHDLATFGLISPDPKCAICKGKGVDKSNPVQANVTRWCKLKPFVPSSGANGQLIRYMKHKSHKVPRDFKTEKETTNKQELERLHRKTKDPIYLRVMEYREFEKMKSTYVEGWKPSDDGHVHTTFTFRPATGQLSSRGPNIQNAPKHDPRGTGLADRFRAIIEAPPGHRIVELDYKSFHALTLGFEANDPNYMRLARLDIHSFLTAHMLKLPEADQLLSWPDDKLRDYLKWVKSDKKRKFTRDFKAKRAILGYGFGLQYRKLYDLNRESFNNQAEAKRTIEMLDRKFPVTAAFRNTIRMRAHRESFLLSRHGYLRYFFDVYRWNSKRGSYIPGEDSEKSIAYLPANDAFGHIKDAMLRLEDNGWNERAGFFNQIHDSLLFCVPDPLFDEAVPAIHAEMSKPSEILVDDVTAPGGLHCAVSVGVGRSWEKMEEIEV